MLTAFEAAPARMAIPEIRFAMKASGNPPEISVAIAPELFRRCSCARVTRLRAGVRADEVCFESVMV